MKCYAFHRWHWGNTGLRSDPGITMGIATGRHFPWGWIFHCYHSVWEPGGPCGRVPAAPSDHAVPTGNCLSTCSRQPHSPHQGLFCTAPAASPVLLPHLFATCRLYSSVVVTTSSKSPNSSTGKRNSLFILNVFS